MAKWKFGLASKDNQITTSVDYSDSNYVDYTVTQHNVDDILKEVERDRFLLENAPKKDIGWRKAFTVPDIVSIEILDKYGIDLHDPATMGDPTIMKKFKYIIKTEYPHLLIST